jgi:hypothetical protein
MAFLQFIISSFLLRFSWQHWPKIFCVRLCVTSRFVGWQFDFRKQKNRSNGMPRDVPFRFPPMVGSSQKLSVDKETVIIIIIRTTKSEKIRNASCHFNRKNNRIFRYLEHASEDKEKVFKPHEKFMKKTSKIDLIKETMRFQIPKFVE